MVRKMDRGQFPYSIAMHDLLRGRFLAFEGPDGSGKSTQLARFADMARAGGVDVVMVREPGGTAIGEQIRSVLLDPVNAGMTVQCEMLLYMASRAQLVEQEISPAIKGGALVLADRFVASTCVYQGLAGGMSMEEILDVARVATAGVMPDLNVVFDVDEATAAGRMNADRDRMELKGAEFHRRVQEGYRALARTHPEDTVIVDATAGADSVFDGACRAIEEHLAASKAC